MSQILTGLDDSAIDTNANDMIMAKEIADALNAHYPKHLWAVNVDGKNGVATIKNLLLSGQWGYLLKLTNMFSASDFRKDVLRAGGEILERYRVNRGRLDEAQYATLSTNFAGDFAFDK
jgi:hypothetical protein